MLEGNPLQYYHLFTSNTNLGNLYFSTSYRNQLNFFPGSDYFEMLESGSDFTSSIAPISPQSDSENSVCSVEVPYEELNTNRKSNILKTNNRCNWVNCGLGFESLDLLANHVSQTHAACGPAGLYYCRWEGCTRNNKGFNARYKMLVHVRTHTNEKPHKCNQCEKSFSRAENLKIHIRSHSGEKPYICPVEGCKKAYSNSSDRFKHTRTHQIDKPYQCKVKGCPKRYTDPSSLRKHVKTYKHTSATNEDVIFRENEKRKVSVIVSHTNDTTPKIEERNFDKINETNCDSSCPKVETLSYERMMSLRQSNIEHVPWNVLTSYTAQKELYYNSYESMDINVPLDLSISTRD